MLGQVLKVSAHSTTVLRIRITQTVKGWKQSCLFDQDKMDIGLREKDEIFQLPSDEKWILLETS